ncbi:hypothetical protein [Massilia sp. X63]|uniref:hypothetical protein n=1 Tax=Massilia sp. X63 TaxID=3237285 RepID=UPI0034DDBF03
MAGGRQGAHSGAGAGAISAELWQVLGRHRWRIAAAVVLLLVAKLATVAVPLVLKRIIDAFSQASLPQVLPLYLLVGYALLRFSSTLFTLHVGQSAVIALGAAAIMVLAGQAVLTRSMSVGDLVLINAYALPVCLPLNALGFVYREARRLGQHRTPVRTAARASRDPGPRPAPRYYAPAVAKWCSST